MPQPRALVAAGLAVLAFLAGCTQPPSGPSPPPSDPAAEYVAPAVPMSDAAALLADLQDFTLAHGERHNNLPSHEGARGWLADRLGSYGLDVWRHEFEADGLPQANIVGIKWGLLRDQVVVVGGHYDTTHWDCRRDSPCAGHKTSHGAYDNGSGTLLTMHLAKAFANVTTLRTVAFVLLDGEERGTEGASAFVEAVVDGETPFGNATLVAAVNMDMWGIMWPGTNAPTLVLHNSEGLYAAFDAARREAGMPDDMVYGKDLVELGSSDYAVFMGHGVPTIFFTSDFGKVAVPGPAPVYTPAGIYPFWHLEDTYASMLAMAGGPMALEAGFQSALDLGAAVVHLPATDPGLRLEE